MMKTIQWSGMTHPGRTRKSNQDAFLGLILYEEEAHYLGKEGEHSLDGHGFVFAVSDGMGGANAGDFASKLALQSVTKRLPLVLRNQQHFDSESRKTIIKTVFKEIHDEVVSVGRFYTELKGMGATLSLCWVHSEGITIGHVGDSRIYHIPDGSEIKQLSKDHSGVGKLLREGKISEREARKHPERHIIDQSIGAARNGVEPQVENFDIKKGDHIILCSDGICDGLYNRSIEGAILRPTPNIAKFRNSERLVKEALFESGRDNLTAMVLHFI